MYFLFFFSLKKNNTGLLKKLDQFSCQMFDFINYSACFLKLSFNLFFYFL